MLYADLWLFSLCFEQAHPADQATPRLSGRRRLFCKLAHAVTELRHKSWPAAGGWREQPSCRWQTSQDWQPRLVVLRALQTVPEILVRNWLECLYWVFHRFPEYKEKKKVCCGWRKKYIYISYVSAEVSLDFPISNFNRFWLDLHSVGEPAWLGGLALSLRESIEPLARLVWGKQNGAWKTPMLHCLSF